MTVLPQALVNVTVPNHRKEHFMEYPEIAAAIEELEKEFGVSLDESAKMCIRDRL